MQKPEFVRENEMHRILEDIEMRLIPARRPNLLLIQKK